MMIRKKSFLALTVVATSLGLVGFSMAATGDDEGPVHKAMEVVTSKNAFITKNLKPAVFKKNQKDIVESTKAIITACKSVRDEAGPAKEAKKTQKEWTDLMDACVKELETFSTEVAKADITPADARTKYAAVSKSCTACHEVFRKDD